MRNRSDQFAKNILREALSRASTPETEVEVLAATQKIDVYCVPDPAREAERAEMGLLGELSAEPTLFEPFRGTPNLRRVRRCICKQLTWHHELERRLRAAAGLSDADAESDEDAVESPSRLPMPAIVVISPGLPETVLDAYGCTRVIPGVYHAVWGLSLRVVVLAELPRARQTLLLRLLGSGRLLREALFDLAALPEEAWEKSIATPHSGTLSADARRAGQQGGRGREHGDSRVVRGLPAEAARRRAQGGRAQPAAAAASCSLRRAAGGCDCAHRRGRRG
jgi:hypothetical protein